ncbi:MAG: LytTR family DNA-binding domain-containing protein [Bacteroidales bacterium]|nr:LytTR family DNA-binding domain-containing protein [Bacteroidales bacterium]
MKIAIVEDETIAVESLKSLINELNANTDVLVVLQSIEESVQYFKTHPMPDLIFMDIHLADGSSFAIFDEVNITCPIIFTTAYNEYALKAFQVNSIDYLLKPISKNDLERAFNKFKNFSGSNEYSGEILSNFLKHIRNSELYYKNHFLVPHKDKLVPLAVSDIAYIYIDSKNIKAVTFKQQTYYLDNTLDELENSLDPKLFFRANRQFIIAHKAIKDISLWFGSKLSVNLNIEVPEKIVVSKAKVKEFKKWFSES